jgi:CDP-paratose 2-epimerase
VDDLADCYLQAVEQIERTNRRVYNIGGGPKNQLSLPELIELLNTRTGRTLDPAFSDRRPGDQKVFVADVTRANAEFGWAPRVSTTAGVQRLVDWVLQEKALLEAVLG